MVSTVEFVIPTYTWQRTGDDFVLIDYNDAAEEQMHGRVADFRRRRASEMFHDRSELWEHFLRCFNEKTRIRWEGLYQYEATGESRYLVGRQLIFF